MNNLCYYALAIFEKRCVRCPNTSAADYCGPRAGLFGKPGTRLSIAHMDRANDVLLDDIKQLDFEHQRGARLNNRR